MILLVRQPKQNKLTPHFNQKPYLVVHKNKTVIKARSTGLGFRNRTITIRMIAMI